MFGGELFTGNLMILTLGVSNEASLACTRYKQATNYSNKVL
jgi:formate/nitrite transporter FocA (FNT family)